MKTYIKWLVAIAVIGGVLLLIGLLNKKAVPEGETIKIGAALALSGDAASWGEMSLKGAQIAVDELNAKGGIHGKKIELVVEDMKSSSQGSISAVQKLLSIDKVSTILGPSWMDVYQGAQGIVAGKNILVISPDAGVEAVNMPKVTENVFSMWYRSQPKAQMTADAIAKQGVKKLVIIHQNDSYYVDFGKRLEDAATKNGIEVVRHETITGGDTDFRTLILKIMADKPDMIFFSFYDQKMIDAFFSQRALFAAGIPLITDEAGQDFSENSSLAPLIDGLLFLGVRPNAVFDERFKAAYNMAPKFGASTGYDSLIILAEALEKQPDNLVGYVKNHSFKTVTYGTMKFDEINGVTTTNEMYVVKQFKDGAVTILR